MATSLLSVAGTAAQSSDFTVAAGSELMVYLTDSDAGDIGVGGKVAIQVKDGSSYYTVDTLTANKPSVLLRAPTSTALTCRVSRPALDYGAAVGCSYT